MVKISELPVYGEPDPPEVIYKPEKITQYREKVSTVRQFLGEYLGTLQGPFENVQQKWEVSKAHTNDLLEYLRDDKDAIPKVSFIGFTGLCGVLMGLKGGIFRRSVYGLTGAMSGAAISYPHHAVDVTRSGWNKGTQKVVDLWNSASETKGVEKKSPENAGTSKENSAKNTNTTTKEEKTEPSLLDHGMSKAEDKDMYTTRK